MHLPVKRCIAIRLTTAARKNVNYTTTVINYLENVQHCSFRQLYSLFSLKKLLSSLTCNNLNFY